MKYILLFAFFATALLAEAQTVQVYGFQGAAGNEATLPPNGQPANGTLSNIRRGSGVSPNNAVNAFSALGFTTGTVIDTSDYYQFQIKSNTGFVLNLDSIVVSERRSNTGIRTFAVRSSLDNFGSDISVTQVPDDNLTRNNQRTPLGSAFKNVASSTTLAFRYYGYGAEADAGTWRLDSIRIYGTISQGSTGNTPSLSWKTTTPGVLEGFSVPVTIKLSSPATSAIAFKVVQKSGTISSADYSISPGTISNIQIPAGKDSVNISLNASVDALTESTETAIWVLRPVSPTGFTIGTDSLLDVTIFDEAPVSLFPPTRTIAQVRGNNTGNAADSVGRNVRLFGTVYGLNQRLTSAGGGYQMYLRDATGGIGIFKTTSLSNIPVLNEGDSVKVMGTVNVFRGLSQIAPDSMVILATGRNLKNPTVALKVNESLESDLVRINGVKLVDPTKWTTGVGTTGFTVKVYTGTDTTDVRIDNDCPLYSQPAPTGTFAIIGMGSQFSTTTTAPWNGGYQLIPRKLADVVTNPVVGPKPKLSFSSTSLTFTESAGDKFCPIVMSAAPSISTSPKIFVKGGTATMGQDYPIFSSVGTIIGPASVLTVNLPVPFLDDAAAEGSETLIMVIRKSGLPSDTAFDIGADSIFTFTITDNDSPLPAGPPFTRTIAQVRGVNTGNAADSVGRNVRLFGTVYGVNQRLTTMGGGYQMYLRDATGGIGIFKTSSFANIPVLNEGDSVKVMGTINVFRGLSQITPDSMVVLATGRSLKNPTVALKVSESLESDLVRINSVQLVDPTKWTTGVGATGFTVKVFKGTDTTDVRIDNDCPLYAQPAPTGTFSIIGMGSQFSVTTTSPWNGGYQLIPRKLADVVTNQVVGPKPKLSFSTTSLTFTESAGIQVCPIVMSSTPSVNTGPAIFVKGGSATTGQDYAGFFAVSTSIGPGTALTNNLPVEFLDDLVAESAENLVVVLRKSGLTSDTAFEIGADSIFTFTIIDNDSPVQTGPPFTRTIGQVRGVNTGNAADSVGRNVRLFGTVYGVNQRLTTTGGGYQMYLRDATGGIGIFKTSSFANIPVLNEGDSVKVMGTVNVFRGLSQITPDSMVVLATGRSLKNPTVALKVNESLESDLVRINGVQLVDPTKWTTGVGATGFSVKVFKGTDTTDVRIDNDCPLYSQPAPTGTFAIIGMGSQFSTTTTAPWNGGYQLIPRKLADVITTPVVGPKPKISFASTSLSFAESNGNQFFSIVMSSAPTVLTTPTVYFKGGTASSGTDYVESNPPSALIGPFTSLSSNLSVQFLDDVVNESTETLTMVLRKSGLPSDTAYEIGADSIFTFTITDNDVSTTEPLPPTRKIAAIRGNNTGNQADSVGKSFRVYGTVYGLNQRTAGAGYQMFIRDETGGIGIFKTSTVSGIQNLTEGDSIKIMGKVEVFRGLSQINPDSIVLLATNRTIKNPEVVSNLGEFEEANLVRFNNVTLVNQGAWTTGTGASGFTVQITDGTNITDVRIDNDCPLYNQPAPTGAFDLIGMGSQFVPGTPAPVAPFPATGYQLIPRRNSDLIPAGSPTGPVASFAVAAQSVGETNDTVRVNVLISPTPAEAYKIQVIVKGGTATSGSDFETPATILIFPANASSAQFKIKLIDDAIEEGAETIQLVLRKDNAAGFPPFASVGIDSLHTVTILANDGSTQEPFPPTRTIAVIRGNNTGNQADSVGKNVRIYGTIYGLNQRLTPAGAGYQMFIRDATGGIGVFKTSFASGISTLTEGDSVKIMGTIAVFRGLSQITPDSMVVLATNRQIKTPTTVTVLDELNEANLVILNGPLTLVDPTAWTTGTGASGFTVKVTDGANVTDVRIDNDCELYNQAAPTSPFTLTGMGSQFATGTAPWVGGYQLIPRRASDLQIIDGVDPVCQCKVDLKAMPNPGNTTLTLSTKEKSGFHYTIYNSLGQKVYQINDADANETIRTENWAAGIYTVKVQETGRVIRWIKK